MKLHTGVTLLVVGVLAFAGALVLLALKLEGDAASRRASTDTRIGEEVVATYVGGEITAQELRAYINERVARGGEHEVCETHGLDHGDCEAWEPCETHPLGSPEAYRMLLTQLVIDRMVDRWIREKGMLAREDVTHRLKHLVEEINLDALAGKMHSDRLKPDGVEMRQYYEEHREEYRGRPFAEVEKEIEGILFARKQAEYVPRYIEELKKNAVIERNYDLLRIPEPPEAAVRSYYAEHLDEFTRPEAVRIRYMTFRGGAGGEDARERAERARARLAGGTSFDEVAKELADEGPESQYLERGGASGRGPKFLETVFRYRRGETTPVLEDGGALYLARIEERLREAPRPFEEVRGEVVSAVYRERERRKMEENKFEALFSIHGKRFTVEQFMREFDELTPEQKKQFATFEAKKNLLDQLIVKELLLEKAEDEAEDQETRDARERLKRRALEQMLHKEEVDEKITVSDDDVREFYETYKDRLIEPTKAKVSVIRVGVGFGEDEREQARKRIEEARAKLEGGADFADVAREYSDDWTATRGGDLDQWIYEGGSHLGELYEHGFHRYVFALAPGETSEIFEFRNNLWIVKLREREESRPQSLEEAKPQIVEILRSLRHEDRMLELQNELMEKSKLVVRDFVLSRMMSAESRVHAGERGPLGR